MTGLTLYRVVLWKRILHIYKCICEELFQIYIYMGVIDYGWSDRRVNQGDRDFDRNSGSRIYKYMCRVQNDRTPMPYLLARYIGVSRVLVPVVRV